MYDVLTASKHQALTDPNGYATVDHAAGVEPYFVEVHGTKVAGADAVWMANTDQYTADTFRVRCLDSKGNVQASKVVEIEFVAYGPPV